jgi:hypothetical protein
MTPNETERERLHFENWRLSFYPELDLSRNMLAGVYDSQRTQDRWEAWLARAASPVTPQAPVQAVAPPAVSAAEGETHKTSGFSSLLKCPFCGGEAECRPDDVGSGGQHVPPYLAGCGWCRVFFVEEEESDAIAAWNRRAATPSPRDCDSPASVESALVVAARKLEGWKLETGEGGFSDDRWVCVRNQRTQCGQDFYESRDPLIFAFLFALRRALEEL